MRLGLMLMLSAGLAINPEDVFGSTYYVRGNFSGADDRNDGTAPARALRTITAAVAKIANAQDVVVVGPGVYREGDIAPAVSGVPGFPVTIAGDATGASTEDDPGPVLVDAGRAHDTGFVIAGVHDVVVRGFHVTNARVAGIQTRANSYGIRSARITIANNVIFSNGEGDVGRGIQLRDTAEALLFNNLVYANASSGIAVGGTRPGSPNARVVNNTVYGHKFGGIVIGVTSASESPGAWVLNNITAENGVGIDVNPLSRCDYAGVYNFVADGYSETTPSDPSDIHGDPAFRAPEGVDGILGGVGFQDDDFSLSTVDAGDRVDSLAIDAGPNTAALFGLDHATTRGDLVEDDGPVDLGFHTGSTAFPMLGFLPIPTVRLYVRVTGDDRNTGQSPAQALRTIRRAAAMARAGTEIIVGPGIYRESVTLAKLSPAGTVQFLADAAGTLTGETPGRVVVDARGAADGFAVVCRASTVVDGFVITNARENGVLVKDSDRSIIRHNVVVSNRGLGIQVADSDDVQLVNNLVYANGDQGGLAGGGIQVGGRGGSARAVIESNTIYANGVHGVFIGAGAVSGAAVVRYNIIARNGGKGLQLDSGGRAGVSAEGVCVEFNINTDSYGPIAPAHCPKCLGDDHESGTCIGPLCQPTAAGCILQPPSDLKVDPGFVEPTAGVDGCLGGQRFWDDSFRLKQRVAGQDEDSPAIDFSEETATMVGLDQRSTRTDNVTDTGMVDLGFHYVPIQFQDAPNLTGDCDHDLCVRVSELVRGVGIALGQSLLATCPEFDSDQNGWVDIQELVEAVSNATCCRR